MKIVLDMKFGARQPAPMRSTGMRFSALQCLHAQEGATAPA